MEAKQLNPNFEDLQNPETIQSHFKELLNEVKQVDTLEIESELAKAKINLTEELQPPPTAWAMVNPKNPYEEIVLGTLGNITTIIGKAKSRKTFFTGIAVSAALSGTVIAGHYKGKLPKGSDHVLYFDTEQGKYHVQKTLKRICQQIGHYTPENLTAYGLRSYSPSQRLAMVQSSINTTENLGFVVIDGVKDLIHSINDEKEATEISSLLMKWSEERNIHIIVILHQNKGDTNARGHVGTELMNKSETVLSVTKSEQDKEISIVEAQYCRNREPEKFAFEIIDGLPVQAENFEFRVDSKKKGFNAADIPITDLADILKRVFKSAKEFGYGELVRTIKLDLKQNLNINLGDNKVKDLITLAKCNDLIIQAKEKAPYTLGELPNNPDLDF